MPLVIVYDRDVQRPVVGPTEANAPPSVDRNAVLAGAIAAQCFQPVASEGGHVAQRFRAVQQGQSAHRLIRETVKRRDPPTFEETSSLPVLEASDQVL